MPLSVIHYPHTTLRHVSKPLRRVDAELRGMAAEMLDLMYAHKGIGLAANQVDLPYRMFVCNITGDPAEKDEEFVFLNPVISQKKGSAEAEEGCLSIPGVLAKVRRPEVVTFHAYTLDGEEFLSEVDGLFARMVQHEVDHLDGVLFIDRLSETALMAIQDDLEEFRTVYGSKLSTKEIAEEPQQAVRRRELESLRT